MFLTQPPRQKPARRAHVCLTVRWTAQLRVQTRGDTKLAFDIHIVMPLGHVFSEDQSPSPTRSGRQKSPDLRFTEGRPQKFRYFGPSLPPPVHKFTQPPDL